MKDVMKVYSPACIESVRYRYAQTVLSTKDLDNLQWAKDFINAYEKKHKKGQE